MKQLELQLAERLLKINVIKLQLDSPFVWASGWNSPIYTDNRQTLSYPDVRNFIKVEMARVIMEHYGSAEVIAGVATGAIAQGALVADTLGMPFVYVRNTPKDHGLENTIEGNIKPGQRVVIVEDQLSTGNNCMKAYRAVRDAGGIVVGAVVMFNYEFPEGAKALKQARLSMKSLTNFGAMLKVAHRMGKINELEVAALQRWHEAPATWLPDGLDVE